MPYNLVEVKFDKAKLERIAKMLKDVPGAMPRVMSSSINRTAVSARAQIVKLLAAKAKLKQKTVRSGTILHKATYNRWQATINFIRTRLPLINFKARQVKKGVKYSGEIEVYSKPDSEEWPPDIPGFVRSAFIATMPISGHKGVFRRFRPTTKRLPIVQLFGQTPGDLFEGSEKIARAVRKESSKKLASNINAQVKYILSRRRAG